MTIIITRHVHRKMGGECCQMVKWVSYFELPFDSSEILNIFGE